MVTSRVPQNSVDHVGSLRRPAELVQAWRDWEAGNLPFDRLHEIQNEMIVEAVAMEERLGLPIVTDGEFRRGGWSRGFLNAVEGFEFRVQTDVSQRSGSRNGSPCAGGVAENPT